MQAEIAALAAETATAKTKIAELQARLLNLAQDEEEADQSKPTAAEKRVREETPKESATLKKHKAAEQTASEDPVHGDFNNDSESDSPDIAPPPPRSPRAAVGDEHGTRNVLDEKNRSVRSSNRLNPDQQGAPAPPDAIKIGSLDDQSLVDAYMRVHDGEWVEPTDTKVNGPVGIALKDPEFLAFIGLQWKCNGVNCKSVARTLKAAKNKLMSNTKANR